MVDVDGDPVPVELIVESIQTQFKLKVKEAEREELERIQSAIEH